VERIPAQPRPKMQVLSGKNRRGSGRLDLPSYLRYEFTYKDRSLTGAKDPDDLGGGGGDLGLG